MKSDERKQARDAPKDTSEMDKMTLKDLTAEDTAEMIIEQYEEKYCQMDDLRAIAFLIPDARRLKPELSLAIAYAAQYLFRHKPQGWRTVSAKMYQYKNILTLPKTVQVLILPAWTRFEMLTSHPRYIKLSNAIMDT